jgi:hypothetical protein
LAQGKCLISYTGAKEVYEVGIMSEEISRLKEENARLKQKVDRLNATKNDISELSLEEYLRYGRQLITAEVGIKGKETSL